ncbi:MAG: hypothetical protein AB7L66_13705, partial [Gemmatimonadales bacterium]
MTLALGVGGASAAWVRAARVAGPTYRRIGYLVAAAFGVATVNYVLLALVYLAPGDPPGPLMAAVSGLAPVFFVAPAVPVIGLLAWPRARSGKVDLSYLVVDLGITVAALVLFILQARYNLNPETAGSVGFATALLLGVNLAVIRGPSLEQSVAFLWLAISIALVMAVNIWGVLFIGANVPVAVSALPPAAALLAAEGLRLGWRW